MRGLVVLAALVVLGPPAGGQTSPVRGDPVHLKSPLDSRIPHFDLKDAIFRDGIAELSSNPIEGLHLGIEEVLRENINDDPRTQGSHFSLHLENKTVREIIEALCDSDSRYAWSIDGISVNVYPKVTEGNPAYLLNRAIERISVTSIPNPDQGLTPLAKLFPSEQIGYAGIGNDPEYAEPWTASFEHVTVRQFINRIAEHLGSRSLWIWQGGKNGRMFTFQQGGFQSAPTIE